MSDNPMQVVIAAFNDEKSADEALKALKQAKRAGLIDIKDAAVLQYWLRKKSQKAQVPKKKRKKHSH